MRRHTLNVPAHNGAGNAARHAGASILNPDAGPVPNNKPARDRRRDRREPAEWLDTSRARGFMTRVMMSKLGRRRARTPREHTRGFPLDLSGLIAAIVPLASASASIWNKDRGVSARSSISAKLGSSRDSPGPPLAIREGDSRATSRSERADVTFQLPRPELP